MKKFLLPLLLIISIAAQSQVAKPYFNYGQYPGDPDKDSAMILVQTAKSTRAYLKISLAEIRNGVVASVYTAGSTYTIPTNAPWVLINPPSTVASLTITMPASPINGQRQDISFGGTMTSGTVVTTLAISANSGQGLIQTAAPTTATAGTNLSYKWNSTAAKWYRIQ